MSKPNKRERDIAEAWANGIYTLREVQEKYKVGSPTVYIKIARALKANRQLQNEV